MHRSRARSLSTDDPLWRRAGRQLLAHRQLLSPEGVVLHRQLLSCKEALVGSALACACWDAFAPLVDELKAYPRKRPCSRTGGAPCGSGTPEPAARSDTPAGPGEEDQLPPRGALTRARHMRTDGQGASAAPARRPQRHNTAPAHALTRLRMDREQDITAVVTNALRRTRAKGATKATALLLTVKLALSSGEEEEEEEEDAAAAAAGAEAAAEGASAEGCEERGHATASAAAAHTAAAELEAAYGRRLSRERQGKGRLHEAQSALSAPGSRRLSLHGLERDEAIAWPQPSSARVSTPRQQSGELAAARPGAELRSAAGQSDDRSPAPARRVQFVL